MNRIEKKVLNKMSQHRLKSLLKAERLKKKILLSRCLSLTGDFYWKIDPEDKSIKKLKELYDNQKGYIREIKKYIK